MRRRFWNAGLVLAAVLSLSVAVIASPQTQTEKPTIKRVTAEPIRSVEGKDNFEAYCAVCHGKTAKGDGPAAPAMKTPVADLTMIAKKSGGKFNAIGVKEMIKGADREMASHGSKDMPIWGPVFRSFQGDNNIAELRVNNLVSYIESIQAK
ncbi:MAG TPA: c-type cytochrome [Vicinamibacterales bacterium]|nr:c-type cytochrome [Vicinamibacterales bacterium]